MNILLAGGAGYIGSHTAVELLEAGHDVVIVDNYCNSSPEAVVRIQELAGKTVVSYEADVKDKAVMEKIFSENKIDCVIHFAGLKAVGESVQKPIEYYRNNIDTTLTLLECMKETGVHQFVFSSSATVYGEENDIPYIETMKKGSCSNPYGWTKSMMEQILEDAAKADDELSVVLLRYFNPIGAHKSGRIEKTHRVFLIILCLILHRWQLEEEIILQYLVMIMKHLNGTCRRDYIHVCDLANGHLKAVEYGAGHKGTSVFNLGTGTPYSVLDIVNAFEKANGIKIKYEFGPRRAGDLPQFWADSDKAQKVLGWKTTRTLEDMCRDTWNWQSNNPNGYAK